jgi:two-component system, OmpR family, sensor histidine kinase KdpD
MYLLVVVGLASFIGRGPTLVAATLSALLWDFFFEVPRYSFSIAHAEDRILLGTYFAVALVLGQLTARIRAQERAEREREERAIALYLLTRELAGASGTDQLVQPAVEHTEHALKSKVVVLLPGVMDPATLQPHSASTCRITEEEQRVVARVFAAGQTLEKFAENLPLTDVLYLPLQVGSRVVGVLGLKLDPTSPLTIHQRNLLNSFCQQIALGLDRVRLQAESEQAKMLAESERLSKTLLNSLSHEIRTPLAAIKAATANLAQFNAKGMSEPQQGMVGEIDSAVERLNLLVGKVLGITRLESGHVKPRLDIYDVRELIADALQESHIELAQHKVSTEIAPGLPLVRMDYALMQESLKNLLSNAAFHTPPGTAVHVTAQMQDGDLVLAVADRGPGIPSESIPRLFNKFYRAPAARPGGTGLGLSIVKGFVEAQGGQVKAKNQPAGGASFTIRLPVQQALVRAPDEPGS